MSTLRIRAAGADDAAVIRRISQAAFAPLTPKLGYHPSPMSADFRDAVEGRFCCLAEWDTGPAGGLELSSKTAIGYVAARPQPGGVGAAPGASSGLLQGGAPIPRNGALYIEALAVTPGAQRRGVGDALMDAIERLAGELSLPLVRLHTDPRLAHATLFYRARGYASVGPPRAGVGPGPRMLFVKSVPTLLQRTLSARAPLRRG